MLEALEEVEVYMWFRGDRRFSFFIMFRLFDIGIRFCEWE